MTDWRNKPDRQDYSKSCSRCSGGMLVNGSCSNAQCPSRGGSGLAKAAGSAAGTGAAASSCDAALAPGQSLTAVLLTVVALAVAAGVLTMIVGMIRGSGRNQPDEEQRQTINDTVPPARGDLL